MLIASFTNAILGITSKVTKISKGYSVTLHDDDAEQVLPVANIYKDVESAILKAKEIANV